MRFEKPDPVPGEEAVLECRVVPQAGGWRMVAFETMDEYAPGGMPGRVLQVVSLSGKEALVHDIAAEEGTGWHSVPLPPGTTGAVRCVLRAENPEPGWNWGLASRTRFRLRTLP
jgi:hypothetical protein